MAGRTEEVEKSERVIKDLEIRERTYLIQLEALDKELAALEFNEYVLQDNIDTLKQDKIITLVKEYVKTKQDLAKVSVKRLQVSNERVKIGHEFKKATDLLKKAQDNHKELMHRLDNNILYINFGKQENG